MCLHSQHRLREAIKQFGPHKASGPDDIKPIALQNLPEVAIRALCCLLRASMGLGYTPVDWRKSKVQFIKKPGKKDDLDPRTYRPISLTSFIFKSLERLVLWHLEETALKNSPMHKHQYAFRKGKSCDHALSRTVDKIERALFRGEYAIGIFLDIKGAFDSIKTTSVIDSMKRHSIPQYICKWYEQYLTNRFANVEVGGFSVSAKLNRGIPQGGVASPVMAWNLTFDRLLEGFDFSPTDSTAFADDGALVTV